MKIVNLMALFIFLINTVGCLSPIAMSTIGTAGSGTPAAFGHMGGGKGESFWIARYDDVTAAALRAGEALSLEIKEKKIETDRTFFRFSDAKDNQINLVIDRRTATLTSILFDVGWFGSVAFGRLLARQIIFELKDSNSFLEDWTPEIQN
jgi:hypothetical protein